MLNINIMLEDMSLNNLIHSKWMAKKKAEAEFFGKEYGESESFGNDRDEENYDSLSDERAMGEDIKMGRNTV